MRATIFLLVLSTLLSYTSATLRLDYVVYDDGTYSFENIQTGRSLHPSSDKLLRYAKDGYNSIIAAERHLNRVGSYVVAAMWIPRKGIIVHSSIKGNGRTGGPDKTSTLINQCTISGHRYNGACAEVACMAEAIGRGWDLNGAIFAVYGFDKHANAAREMHPCHAKHGKDGCKDIIRVTGGRCISKRAANNRMCASGLTLRLPKIKIKEQLTAKTKLEAPAQKAHHR